MEAAKSSFMPVLGRGGGALCPSGGFMLGDGTGCPGGSVSAGGAPSQAPELSVQISPAASPKPRRGRRGADRVPRPERAATSCACRASAPGSPRAA